MMHPGEIERLARQAARTAAREHKYPLLIEQDDLDEAQAAIKLGKLPHLGIPFVGNWHPRGYKPTKNLYFVDMSGWGRPGELALTQAEFLGKLRAGYAYAVVEVGQFQCYVQEFLPRYPSKAQRGE